MLTIGPLDAKAFAFSALADELYQSAWACITRHAPADRRRLLPLIIYRTTALYPKLSQAAVEGLGYKQGNSYSCSLSLSLFLSSSLAILLSLRLSQS